MNKPRNPWVAGLLSLLLPGLGQFYNGQPMKAALFFALTCLLPFLLVLTNAAAHFYGLVALLVAFASLEVTSVADSVRWARKQQQYAPKRYNTWYVLVLIWIAFRVTDLLVNPVEKLGLKSIVAVTPSSEPTLLVGDWFVVSTKAYASAPVAYGDLIAFTRPDGAIWIFRVVGLPGDRVDVDRNLITLNGQPVPGTFVANAISGDQPVSIFTETLPDGTRYNTYRYQRTPYNAEMLPLPVRVPANSYFLLGDNRDNANDSRYIGCVPRPDVLGKALYTYWGKSRRRINTDLSPRRGTTAPVASR